jgi:Centromere protein Scm3
MEPSCKRPRLTGPVESKLFTANDSDGNSDLCDEENNFLYAEKDWIEGGNDIGAIPDPDNELDQIRARLDDKLKSKFEAIFEKYGRDFTGIGDEIDLRTGEIVVDNGHLLKMEDERDAGTPNHSLLEAFTQEPERRLGSNETEDDDESDGMDNSYVAPEDMEEDDMIFFQDSGAAVRNPATPPPQPSLDSFSQQQADLNPIDPQAQHPYPSESQIMAQFGQRLGPHIARYVSQQRVQDDSNIEPAWRTPGLPLATPGKRPILKSILINPDIDRSPSPKGSSVWAPSMPRGRRRRDGADVAAVFKGETIVRDRKWYSSGFVSTTVTKKTTERAEPSQSRRTMSVPLKKKEKSTEPMVAFSQRNRANSAWANTSYKTAIVSDSERESSDGASISYYDTRHSQSDPEINRDYRRRNQSDHKNLSEHRIPVVSSESSHLKHELKRDRAPKVAFTQADDDAIIEWIEEAQRLGFSLWSENHWKMLAEKVSYHISSLYKFPNEACRIHDIRIGPGKTGTAGVCGRED